MSQAKISDKGKIRVADITLAQLSRGLYRSNATVFKELINNSYDADAKSVRIETNFPSFDFISCIDDGIGMTLDKFISHFSSSGIGSSTKRKGDTDITPIHKRPIIGRLGIGMMAVGQLCHSFEIESHYNDSVDGKDKAFKGQIILTDDAIEIVEEIIRKDNFNGKEIDVGDWSYNVIEYEEAKKGFRVYSSDVRGTFRREMLQSFEDSESKTVPFEIEKLSKVFYQGSSIRDCKPYLETIWELCVLCPLPYYEKGNSPLNFKVNKVADADNEKLYDFIKKRNETLIGYDFTVHFDGINLKRVVQLPTAKDVSPKLYFFSEKKTVFDSELKFSGYIFSQIPKAIKPFELNGVQIRLRNVGIGGYDSTFMKYYKQVETIRSKWVSGEIFVDAGLESALNIDRDSFNEHEEHYKFIQTFIHDKLDVVFDEARRLSSDQNETKRKNKIKEVNKNISEYLETATKGKLKLVLKKLADTNEVVVIDEKNKTVILNTNAKVISKKKANDIYRITELVYEVADYVSKDDESRKSVFRNLLIKFFKEII
jgi:hypothetical protein